MIAQRTAQTEERLFADLTTEELRARAIKTDGGRANWHLWTREMLLALFQNRFGASLPSTPFDGDVR